MAERRFTVLIGCYGDYPHYSIRAIRSVLNHTGPKSFDLAIGCNACGPDTLRFAQGCARSGVVDCLVESARNINKDPMMRILIETVRTDYFLWMDDDSHFTATDWPLLVNAFLASTEFDCAGHIFYMHRTPDYRSFLCQRPWWKSENDFLEEDHRERAWFATGGLWMARTAFVRAHDFPDRGMTKMHDDLLLGDLVSQVHGSLVQFPRELMDAIRISDGDRRGSGEHSHWTNE